MNKVHASSKVVVGERKIGKNVGSLLLMSYIIMGSLTLVNAFRAGLPFRSNSSTTAVAKYTSFFHRQFASVTGTVYTIQDCVASASNRRNDNAQSETITITLFTKEGCTLCDKVKDILYQVRDEYPHTLEQKDITDAEHSDWFDRYKYDIPVLHFNHQYWCKHRLTAEVATKVLGDPAGFVSPAGEPNAAAHEH